MSRILLSLLILAAAACGSPAAPAAPAPSSSSLPAALNGTLTESAPTQSRLLAGATITVQNGNRAGATFTTDADGRFAITDISGPFDFSARAAGHVDATFHVDALTGPVSQAFGLKPTMASVTEMIGAFDAPHRQPTSFFRDVHHDGFIVVSELYFYWSSFQYPNNPLTRTIEVWNGTQLVGSATINRQQYFGVDLQLLVSAGARYEIRITGGDWSRVKIVSPN